MQNFGIKATIFDFFVYFIPGLFFVFLTTINLMVLAPNCAFSVFMTKDFLDMVKEAHGFFTVMLFITIPYIFGLVLSAVASIVIGRGYLRLKGKGKIESIIKDAIPEDMTNRLEEKFYHEFNCNLQYDASKHIRLCIVSIAKNEPKLYEKAEIFQRIYGTFRTLCIIFLISAIYILFLPSLNGTPFTWPVLAYFIILLFCIRFSLDGYYRFYRYYFQDILFSYYSVKGA